jgi:hypothetical protein
MPTYLVKFTQTRRYAENVTAETPDLAIDEAIKALNRGELEPEDSTLDYFEAEEFAPSTGPPSNRLAGIHALPVTLFEAVLPQLLHALAAHRAVLSDRDRARRSAAHSVSVTCFSVEPTV